MQLFRTDWGAGRTMYKALAPRAIAANVAFEALRQTIPAGYLLADKQFIVRHQGFASASTTWATTLTLGGTVLSSATLSGVSSFDRELTFIPDRVNNKIYIIRDTKSAVDVLEVAYTAWAVAADVVLSVTAGRDGKILTTRSTEYR